MHRLMALRSWVASLLLASMVGGASFAQDIDLAPGDQISLTVIGARDLDTIATIDANGTVTLPLIGSIKASGAGIGSLTTRVAERLTKSPIRLAGTAGAPEWRQLDPDSVFMSVVAYRPIYVSGDLRVAGEIPYRPGLTARQAMAIAGGPGRVIGEADPAVLARMLADRSVLAEQVAVAEAAVKLLTAELAAIDTSMGGAPAPATPADGIASSDAQWLGARSELRDVTSRTEKIALEKMQERLSVLEQLLDVSKQTLDSYEEEYNRIQELADRGVTTANAVNEAQRGVLSFSSRVLEAESEAYKMRLDIARTADQAEADRIGMRIDTLERLKNGQDRLRQTKAEIEALEMRLSLLGGQISNPEDYEMDVEIFRTGTEEAESIDATLDTVLLPGDVIVFRQRLKSQRP